MLFLKNILIVNTIEILLT